MTFPCQSAFLAFSFPFLSPVLFVSWFMASIGCEVLMCSASYWTLIYSLVYGSYMASCRLLALLPFFCLLCLSFFPQPFLDRVYHLQHCYKYITSTFERSSMTLCILCNFWRVSHSEGELGLSSSKMTKSNINVIHRILYTFFCFCFFFV